jgi:hypothetical protein
MATASLVNASPPFGENDYKKGKALGGITGAFENVAGRAP